MKHPVERFIEFYDMPDEGCWEWRGHVNERGYGRFYDKGNHPVFAHRFTLLAHGIDLDPNLTVDHLCRNKRCVRPDHLEQVTKEENKRRYDEWKRETITHCPYGHEFTEENSYEWRGMRQCRECGRTRAREYQRRRRAAV